MMFRRSVPAGMYHLLALVLQVFSASALSEGGWRGYTSHQVTTKSAHLA